MMATLTGSQPSAVCFGEYELDLRTRELRTERATVDLQEQPFQVLAALLAQPGELVTREELTKALWPSDTFVDFEHSLNKAVNRLREALNDSADSPRFIETLPRRGYRFIASVTTVARDLHELPANSQNRASPESPQETQKLPDAKTPLSYQWKRAAVILGAVVILATVFRLSLGTEKAHTSTFNLEKMQITKLTNNGKAESIAISPDGRYVVYVLRNDEGLGLWIQQVATRSDVQILPPAANVFEGVSFSPDGNYIYFVRAAENAPDFRYLYVMPVLGGPARLLATDVDSPVSFAHDGSQFVYTRADPARNVCEVRIANAGGSNNRVLATIPGAYAEIQPGAVWSPDGRIIAVSFMLNGKQPASVLDLVSTRDGSVRTLYSNSYGIGRPIWLPAGDALLVSLRDQAGRGQLWRISYPKGETERLTNDLADYGARIDATRDARTVAAIQSNQTANVWVVPLAHPSKSRQITAGELPLLEVAPAPQGKIVAASGEGELWLMNMDGSGAFPVADTHNASNPVSCGSYLLFNSSQPGKEGLRRSDSDGSNPTMLATGLIWSPVCSPDLKWVYYVDLAGPMKIWRTQLGGGTRTEVATIQGIAVESRLIVSPDGKLLAYAFLDYTAEPVMKVSVISLEGGVATSLQVPGWTYERACLRWSPDGKHLQALVTRNGVTNIWEKALAGGDPRQLTKFTSGQIFDFSWSADGKSLLLARGDVTRDAILLSDFR